MRENYVYAVARIRAKEVNLFGKQEIERLVSLSDYDSCVRYLHDKGWSNGADSFKKNSKIFDVRNQEKSFSSDFMYEEELGEFNDLENMLFFEQEKLWKFVNEIIKDKDKLNIFKIVNDYNNLKAVIKKIFTEDNSLKKIRDMTREIDLNFSSSFVREEEGIALSLKKIRDMTHETDFKFSSSFLREEKDTAPKIFSLGGNLEYETLLSIIAKKDYHLLPAEMTSVAKEAMNVLLHTRDGQLCDLIIDKAALEAVISEGEGSQESIIKEYAELIVAIANIKIAVRGCQTAKKLDFFLRSMVLCKSLDIEKFAKAAACDLNAIYDYLEMTLYSDVISEIKKSSAAFEKWCDDKIINYIKKEKYNPFTISPIISYILAKQNEIKIVRMILLLKLNEIDDSLIKERLRETYV